MTTPRVSLVVPVNHSDVQPEALLEGYGRALRESGYPFEFVIVLDGVSGAVDERFRALSEQWPVRIVRLQGGGLGESIALSAGAGRAAGAFIVNAPQYLQVEPADLVSVVHALESGADCVATWRHPRVDPWLNRLQSRMFNWVLRIVMGMPFHDLNSSLRGFRRQVLEEVNVYGDLYRFLPVLALRQGFRVVEVKVRHREEQGRAGFYGVGVYLRRLLDILAISFLTRFTQKPLRFFGALGLLAMVVGLAMCAVPLYRKLSGTAGLQDQPLFVVGSFLMVFGVQLVGFGLVGEIIIFANAPNLRDYKIEDVEPSGPVEVPEGPREPADPEDLPLRVRELLPGEDARWDAYVQRHPQGSFFHLSGWRKVVEEVFQHRSHDLVLERGRRWLGILPLADVRSPFLGRNLISVPYGVYGGVLAEEEEGQAALMREAVAVAQRLGAGYVELRHLQERPGDRPGSELYVTFRKELPGDPGDVLPGIPKKARAEVRRARDRHGLTCRVSEDLDTFYGLFVENKRRLGSPSLPRRWFRALVDEFGAQVVIHQVDTPGGEPIAAVMSFCYKDTLHAYYSGSRTGMNKTGVNDFVYCRIMEWAVRQGYRVFDFGRSRRGTGPAAFKKNMGFTPQSLHYEYLLVGEGAELPDFHPSNPKLDLPRRIWSRIPQFVTARLGGRLSRYLP